MANDAATISGVTVKTREDIVLPGDTTFLTDETALRALHHAPMSRATDKVLRALDVQCRRIVELSPFCVVSTQGPDGADVSPRGDPPGFVSILDARTLLVPDRVGNNRLEAMSNLLVDPRIGILFLVPGMNETLRINGTARITDDAPLLAPSAMQNHAPKVGLIVTVEEAFLHCAKALVRSDLWNPGNISTARSCRATRQCCSTTSGD
ncbi:MAG TPA: MSMEG_1061 family FMN-dependent PPOX-type flavoprotein [Bradyrhizobium sp.]|nr:MSMEG_1061 family FMN-dependent PPOX-type flavoprotein [Bradyrhizobium sp.]